MWNLDRALRGIIAWRTPGLERGRAVSHQKRRRSERPGKHTGRSGIGLKRQGAAESGTPNRARGHLPKKPAPDRTGQRTSRQAPSLRSRRDGEDRRSPLRTAGCDACPALRAGHQALQIYVPALFRCGGPSTFAGTCRARGLANRRALSGYWCQVEFAVEPARRQQILDVSEAECKPMVCPDGFVAHGAQKSETLDSGRVG